MPALQKIPIWLVKMCRQDISGSAFSIHGTCVMDGGLGWTSRGKHQIDRVEESWQGPRQVGSLEIGEAFSEEPAAASPILLEGVSQRHWRIRSKWRTTSLTQPKINHSIYSGTSFGNLWNERKQSYCYSPWNFSPHSPCPMEWNSTSPRIVATNVTLEIESSYSKLLR